MNELVVKGFVIENSEAVMLARITSQTGGNVVQADITSISVKVFDQDDESQVGSTLTPAVSSVVYNTLQTDSRWTRDATGYNVAIVINGSYFPSGNRPYRVEAKFTPVTGGAFYLIWEPTAIDILSE